MPYRAVYRDDSRPSDLSAVPQPEAGRYYRWIRNDRASLSGHLNSGHGGEAFRLEGPHAPDARAHAESLGLSADTVDAAGRILWGDLVLASISIEEANRRKLDMHKRAAASQDLDVDALNDQYAQRGIKLVSTAPEELQAKKAFAQGQTPTQVGSGRKSGDRKSGT